MSDVIEFIKDNIVIFDLIIFLIIIYTMVQCAAKGFTLSLLSFSKWLIALIITIVLVPKLNPWVQDYIESKFIADIGLGVFIYIVSLFIIINIGKAISRAVTWSGLGSVDKTFGLIFGIFRGILLVTLFYLGLIYLLGKEKSLPSIVLEAHTFNYITTTADLLRGFVSKHNLAEHKTIQDINRENLNEDNLLKDK